MVSNEFHIESNHQVVNRLLPKARVEEWFSDSSQAVAVAAKCVPNSFGDEVRVVHVPTGEVIFRTAVDTVKRDPLPWNDVDPT